MITHIDAADHRCFEKVAIPTSDLVVLGAKARRTAALYRQVSSQVSIRRCQDDALAGLLNALRAWFPSEVA